MVSEREAALTAELAITRGIEVVATFEYQTASVVYIRTPDGERERFSADSLADALQNVLSEHPEPSQ